MLYLLVLSVASGAACLLSMLASELWLGLLPRRQRRIAGMRPEVVVIVPAHNEQAGIARTLNCLSEQCTTGDRIIVVADNCTDDTAQVARECGVEVIERCDPVAKGKGYAIDFGVRYVHPQAPAVVIVCDADCTLKPGSVEALTRQVAATGKPAQALYLMRQPRVPGPESSVSTFAFLIKNWVRPRGLQRMRLPVMLTGSGMAFPWQAISQINVASGEIVEDLAIGLELTRRGLGPTFCEEAIVWSELPSNPEAAIAQRTRWEHGYLATIFRVVPKLVLESVTQLQPTLLFVALDLAIPPLALLVLVSLFLSAFSVLFGLLTGQWWPLIVVLVPGVMTGLGLVASWFVFARKFVPARLVCSIPFYVVRKLNIYQRFLTKRQQEWVRTER